MDTKPDGGSRQVEAKYQHCHQNAFLHKCKLLTSHRKHCTELCESERKTAPWRKMPFSSCAYILKLWTKHVRAFKVYASSARPETFVFSPRATSKKQHSSITAALVWAAGSPSSSFEWRRSQSRQSCTEDQSQELTNSLIALFCVVSNNYGVISQKYQVGVARTFEHFLKVLHLFLLRYEISNQKAFCYFVFATSSTAAFSLTNNNIISNPRTDWLVCQIVRKCRPFTAWKTFISVVCT